MRKHSHLFFFVSFSIFLFFGEISFAQISTSYKKRNFTTQHSIKLDTGEKIKYKVQAEDILLSDYQDNTIGTVFSFSYIRTNTKEENRPVLFIFNGGPGSSSLWLHMGIGPKYISSESGVLPPYQYENNPYCLLDIADMVFIDPIGTGYSKIIGAGNSTNFYGVEEDASSMAQFIEKWLMKHNRWNSPKFLMGESYGGCRVSILPSVLSGSPFYSGVLRGITINGIIMLGANLGSITMEKEEASELSNLLPSMAATAWYYGRAGKGKELSVFVDEASKFAQHEYYKFLKQTSENSNLDTKKITTQLSYYTGLSKEQLNDDIKLKVNDFTKKLLADSNLVVSLYDSRYTLKSINPTASDPVADDPAMAQYTPMFIANFNSYINKELNISIDETYKAIQWNGLLEKWNWSRKYLPISHRFVNDLANAMYQNQKMRVFIASGYYDLVTPATAVDQCLRTSNVDMNRITHKKYQSGHMLYVGKPRQEFQENIREFIKLCK